MELKLNLTLNHPAQADPVTTRVRGSQLKQSLGYCDLGGRADALKIPLASCCQDCVVKNSKNE